MQEKLRKLQEGRKGANGFTLIELLIVIVILGVLAGIVVFAVGAFNNDGKAAACKSDQKNFEIASEAFYAKNNHVYPKVATDLVPTYIKDAPTNVVVTYDATGATAPTTVCAP
jgi:prepilin-type N-terminal cleavage/methylation domain-containing protein